MMCCPMLTAINCCEHTDDNICVYMCEQRVLSKRREYTMITISRKHEARGMRHLVVLFYRHVCDVVL